MWGDGCGARPVWGDRRAVWSCVAMKPAGGSASSRGGSAHSGAGSKSHAAGLRSSRIYVGNLPSMIPGAPSTQRVVAQLKALFSCYGTVVDVFFAARKSFACV